MPNTKTPWLSIGLTVATLALLGIGPVTAAPKFHSSVNSPGDTRITHIQTKPKYPNPFRTDQCEYDYFENICRARCKSAPAPKADDETGGCWGECQVEASAECHSQCIDEHGEPC